MPIWKADTLSQMKKDARITGLAALKKAAIETDIQILESLMGD